MRAGPMFKYSFYYSENEKLKSLKLKAKASDSYIARLTRTKHDQPRFTVIGSDKYRQEPMVLQRCGRPLNARCTDTSAARHFGGRTFRQQRNTAEVSGHFGSTADVSYGLFGSAAEVSRGVYV